MSQSSASAVRTLSVQSSRTSLQRAASALGPAPTALPGPVAVPPPAAPAPAPPERRNNTHDLDVIGPRKLIRPHLPEGFVRTRRQQRPEETPYLWRPTPPPAAATHESSSAESFYFQKQIQSQTPMIFVLDDGERIEGCIEWYDRDVIKVRSSSTSPFRSSDHVTRMLIYKTGIKYLFKAGENQPQY
ncbi:MAG TPA: hypothetical protein VHU89_16265 [Acidobacteriaceae bacterium]|jgi:hypothetical protein|nr:hypothetical protein [Acidobacteriaceae bacterium]